MAMRLHGGILQINDARAARDDHLLSGAAGKADMKHFGTVGVLHRGIFEPLRATQWNHKRSAVLNCVYTTYFPSGMVIFDMCLESSEIICKETSHENLAAD